MDVFISYSSKDKAFVRQLYNYLEDKGLRCFVDHRDIPKGENWRKYIVNAIENCKIVAVIFTEEYNIATATDTELMIADDENKPFVIYRIAPESINFKGAKKWCLSGKQWINAIGRQYDKFESLYDCLKHALKEIGKPDNEGIPEKQTEIVSVDLDSSKLKFIRIKGGSFIMGASKNDDKYAQKDEYPAHEVTLDDYYIMETPVTQSMWTEIMGSNPSYNQGNLLPVDNITWEQCMEFIGKLQRTTGRKFRLPTEAEWEYAAKGGVYKEGYLLSGSSEYKSVAWTAKNSNEQSHEVKAKLPNKLGIYDMSGNVNEWCGDWYEHYDKKSLINPQGPKQGVCKVTRGGSWMTEPKCCRNSYRDYCSPMNHYPDLGFRLVLEL